MLNVWHIEGVTSYVWHIFKVMWDESGNNAGICDIYVECVGKSNVCRLMCGTSLKSCGMKNGITREYVTYMLNVWHIECVARLMCGTSLKSCEMKVGMCGICWE